MRVLFALIAASMVVGPAFAEPSDPLPTGIVYWGNSNTGVAVRIVNQIDGEKKAEAEVKRIGGEGWKLLEKSNKPGFGAAICVRKGDSILFHTAHGYPTAKEAVAAATVKAKATGGATSYCSRSQWVVNEYTNERVPSGVVGTVKALVRKMVICSQPERKAVKLPPVGSVKPTENKSECPEGATTKKDGAKLVCMCVRG